MSDERQRDEREASVLDATDVFEAAHEAEEDAGDDAGAPADAPSDALADLEQQRDEYLADLQRLKADFDNFRKRTMREGAALREAGAASVLSSLLDVVDEFELAVLASESSSDVERLRHGVELVYGKLVDTLRSAGLEKFGVVGEPFDPQRHDAVQSVEDEVERAEPVVAEVLRAGYRVGDRILRPAMVKVVR